MCIRDRSGCLPISGFNEQSASFSHSSTNISLSLIHILSYTALTHHGFIEQINNGDLPANSYLKKNDPGDNSAISRLNVKHCITKIIDSDGIGLDISKLYSYIERCV